MPTYEDKSRSKSLEFSLEFFLFKVAILLICLSLVSLKANTGDACSSAENITITPGTTTQSGKLEYQWWYNKWNKGQYYYYKITPPSDGTLTITSTGFNTDTDAKLYNSTCSSLLTSDTSYNDNISLTHQVSANTTYKLDLYNYSYDYKDDFTLTITFTPDNPTSSGERDFELRHQENLKGDVKVIGNTVLCEKNSNGQCVETAYNESNADIYLEKAPTSSATLEIPQGATIVYARIYWQGREAATNSQTSWDENSRSEAGRIFLKKDDGDYHQLTADVLDTSYTDVSFSNNWGNYPRYVNIYHASADASSVVTSGGTYSIDTSAFYTNTGKTNDASPSDGLGNYGAWTLVVIYKDPNSDKLRNISIFDGYKIVSSDNPSVDVSVDGFLTPTYGEIDSKLYTFAGEGDKYIDGDEFKMAGLTYNTTLQSLNGDNAFNSSITISASRSPELTNNNGIDIQSYDVGTTTNAKGIITNSETGAKFQFTSSQDTYFPSLVVFSTELYKPRVCYYIEKITDENNNTVYENKAFVDNITIDPNKKYKIDFWISNMKKTPTDPDLEVAKLTQVYVDMNDFNYTTNSTMMQNINESSFVSITDQSGDDIGEWDSNKSTWRVGIGADATQGGELPVASSFDDNNSKVFVSLEGSFVVDSNASDFDLTSFFNFKTSFRTDSIVISPENALVMEQCVDLNTSGLIYKTNPGLFNVEEKSIFNNFNSHDLPTQIVKKFGSFLVTSYDPSNSESLKNVSTIVAVELVDTTNYDGSNEATLPALTPRVWVLFDNTNEVDFNKTTIQYAIDNTLTSDTILNLTNKITNPDDYFKVAKKNVAFRISYNNMDNYGSNPLLDKQNNGSWTISNWRTSWEDESCVVDMNNNPQDNDSVAGYCNDTGNNPNTLAECMECVYGKDVTYILSRDNFAIRPDRFKIDINSSSPLKAGEDFNIIFRALNDLNESSLSYDEVEDSSFKVETNETKIGCINGAFNPSINSSWNFSDGNKSIISSYSEVGIVNIKIQEINGSEFANVDANDTYPNPNGISRFITPAEINATFLPHHFKVDATLSSGGNNYTYISNDLNMSTTLNIDIIAQTENNSTTKNYNSSCYAQDIDLNVSYDNLNITPSGAITKLIYAEDTNVTTSAEVSINSNISLVKPKGVFTTDNNGTASLKLKVNFDRNETVGVNPFRLAIRDINITDTNGTFGNKDLNQTNLFYYGRVHAPDYRFEGNSGLATIYYEVYSDQNKSTRNSFGINGSESVDSINWYVNTLHTNSDGNVTKYKSSNAKNIFSNGTASELNNNANISNGAEAIIIKAPTTPYKDKIIMTPSSWLVYNLTNSDANTTDFLVEFYKNGSWAGQGNLGKTVDLNVSTLQNKRLDW